MTDPFVVESEEVRREEAPSFFCCDGEAIYDGTEVFHEEEAVRGLNWMPPVFLSSFHGTELLTQFKVAPPSDYTSKLSEVERLKQFGVDSDVPTTNWIDAHPLLPGATLDNKRAGSRALRLSPGIWIIIGGTGSGKSRTANMISGRLRIPLVRYGESTKRPVVEHPGNLALLMSKAFKEVDKTNATFVGEALKPMNRRIILLDSGTFLLKFIIGKSGFGERGRASRLPEYIRGLDGCLVRHETTLLMTLNPGTIDPKVYAGLEDELRFSSTGVIVLTGHIETVGATFKVSTRNLVDRTPREGKIVFADGGKHSEVSRGQISTTTATLHAGSVMANPDDTASGPESEEDE